MRKYKTLFLLSIIALFISMVFSACGSEDDLLKLEDLDIEAVDVIDIPVGTYTLPYTIENLSDYISEYGLTIAVSVLDNEQNIVDVTGNTITVEAGKTYTVNVQVKQGETVIKSKTITVTAVVPSITLAAPQDLSIYNYDQIIFNNVENAVSYDIDINGTVVNTVSNIYDISALYNSPNNYTVKVRAKAPGYIDSPDAELTFSTIIESISLAFTPVGQYVEGDFLNYDLISVLANYEDQRNRVISLTSCLISKPEGVALTPEDTSVEIIHTASGKRLSFAITVTPIGQAVWTVNFNGACGVRTGGGEEVQNITHNGSAVAPVYTKKDHIFLGWDVEFLQVIVNITVNAQWLDTTSGTTGLDFEANYDYQSYYVSGYWGTAETVVIPSTYNGYPVISIGNSAFFNNKTVKALFMPASVRSYGITPFFGCTNMTAFYVSPESEYFSAIEGVLYDKEQKTLWECPKGKQGTLTIPEGIQRIGYAAMDGCTNLTDIIIPDSVYDIADRAFYNTAWLNNKSNGVVYAGKVVYTYKGEMTPDTIIELSADTVGIAGAAFELQDNLSRVLLENGLLKIVGNNAFSGCDNLTDMLIPDTVIKIGAGAFQHCSKLENIYIPETLVNIGSEAFKNTLWYSNQPDGIVYAGKVAIAIKGEMPESVILDDGTLAIGDGVFSLYDGNTTLKNIHIPKSEYCQENGHKKYR